MGPLVRLVVARIAQGAGLLLLASFLLFGLLSHLPGDPVDLLVASNPSLSVDDVARLKRLRGLDQPWPVQWWRWLYGHHAPKTPPAERELPAVVGVLPAPRPFAVTVAVPAPVCPAAPLCARAWGSATLTPTIEGATSTLSALVPEAGATTLYVVVEDADGQQALWRLPVYVAPPRAAVLERVVGSVDDDGNVIDEDAHAAAVDIDDRDGPTLRREAVAKRPFAPLAKARDDDTAPGQRVVDDGTANPVVVRGPPLVDDDAFVGGLLFGELGYSHATKRPVKELLFGVDVVCGDGVVDAGEACDDGNAIDVDGCTACAVDGASFFDGVDVAVAGAVAGQGRIGNTLALTLPALLCALALALVAGTAAGLRPGGVVDVVVRVAASLAGSMPAFFVALLFIWVFAEGLALVPSGGLQSPGIAREGAGAAVVDRVAHLVLPWAVLVVFWSGRFVRQVRSAVVEARAGDHVRSARARGLAPRTVVVRHILPNAAVPLVTLVGLSLPALFGGALLTETVFAYPGMGRLQYDAIQQNDSYVAIVVFLGNAALVLTGSLLADVVVFALDPRTRRARTS